MSWVDDNLMPGETVLYRAKNPVNIILEPILFKPLEAGFVIGSENTLWRILTIPIRFLFWLIIGLFFLPSAVAAYRKNERVVTSQRLIGVNAGLISRQVLEVRLTSVMSLEVEQGVIDRLSNKGDIVLQAGPTTFTLVKVPNPMEFRHQALAAIAAA